MPPAPPLLPEDAARFSQVDAPQRVQALLGRLLGLARLTLTAPLTLCVVELERDLRRQAEQARNSQVQADLLAQAREIHPFAEGFSQRFLDALVGAMQQLFIQDEAPTEVPLPTATRPALAATLTLVDDTDIDRDIVLSEIVRRETLRSANALQLLGQRMAVLAASPAIDTTSLPFGPAVLCNLVRRLGDAHGLELASQLALYRSFERQVLERLGEVLERANLLLDHEGVLPGLVYTPYLQRSPSSRRVLSGPAQGTNRSPLHPASAQAALTSWNGAAPSRSWSSVMQQAFGAMPAPASSGPPPAQRAGPSPSVAMSTSPMNLPVNSPVNPPVNPAVDGTASMMASLHDLLEGAQAAVAGSSPPRSANEVPHAAVDAVLAQLQARLGTSARPGTLADVQDALLAQLRADHGPQAQLPVRDNDTLDLLGRLFNEIRALQRPFPAGQDLLGRLQVPLARAALADPGFFARDEHPARELLTTIAESGAAWLGGEDIDPQLVQRMEQVVEDVVSRYHDDPVVFDTANAQLQEQMQTAAHRAELAERRHVEAARGRERLDVARRRSSSLVDQVCHDAAPPRFVQTLLRQAWADALTLTQLRHGEGSPQWQERLDATARIGAITAQAPGSGTGHDAALALVAEEALLQVGYHAEEAQAIARRLSTPGGEDDSTSRTELSARLKARARIGSGDATPSPRVQAPLTRSTAEEDCHRQLLALPFGSWFEFVVNQQGDVRRQRLSWYSQLTDHALFVNARGQKVAEHTLDAVARMMAHGQARLVTEARGRLVDRAWQATLRALRALAGDVEQGDQP